MTPESILLFSGKRKSGKDFITDRLHEILGKETCTIIKISEPIKSHWAESLNLDLKMLLSDGEYKEKYRLEMIKWSEEMRAKDYGCFCRIACDKAAPTKVWIVSDVRRKTDLKWFRETYGGKIKTIRVFADDEVRKKRGWAFQKDVDDAESECDLDDVEEWDFVIDNSSEDGNLSEEINRILNIVK